MAGKNNASLTVQTPSSAVTMTGGEAQVSSDEKKATRLAVYSGKSTLSAQKIDARRAVWLRLQSGSGQASPTVPKPLPPAPMWSKLPLRVLVDKGAGAPPIVGEYDGTKANEWHVQVGRDDKFRDVVVDTKVPVATKRFEGKMPGPGHYYLRISAIDDDKFEGPFGDTARILVVHPTVAASAGSRTIALDPPDSPCMRVGNVRLTWVKAPLVVGLDEPVRLRCAPIETDPTTLLDIDHLDDFPSP